MRDAWGLQPSGLHSGNLVNYGNFNQCYYFKHNHPTLGYIQGQNCMINVRRDYARNPFNIPSFRVAICIPAACSAQQLMPRLDAYFNETLGLSMLKPPVDTDCERQRAAITTTTTADGYGSALLFWCAIAFFVVYIAFVVVATIYERCRSCWHKKVMAHTDAATTTTLGKTMSNYQCLASFSVYPNLQQVMNVSGEKISAAASASSTTQTSRPRHATTLDCLDGVRALSLLWVIYQHTSFMQMSFPLMNENYKYQV